jgi:hypothetical protein
MSRGAPKSLDCAGNARYAGNFRSAQDEQKDQK